MGYHGEVITFAGAVLSGIGQAALMAWETLWALILGFGISGAVQAFVPRSRMQRALGAGVPGLARATFFGAVSSSCSYAAAAMARSLFLRGADFTTALVFMVASTNLVVDLGIVLAVLIGWQFTASMAAGGLIMIVLLAALARITLPRRDVAALARSGAASEPAADDAVRHGIRTRAGWAQAARYTLADMRMLRREMLVGFTVAGFLSALIPAAAWAAVFWRGHGWLSSVENVVVGPAVAVVSFVCSIGNVPLAAALWHGGISFGGVVSFLLADLITLPLLLVYRRMYGWRITLWILVTFWVAMALAGLVVEAIFGGLGWIPSSHALLATSGVATAVTAVLNVVALVALGFLVSLSRSTPAGRAHATDPVCGMQVERQLAPAQTRYRGQTILFCSEGCRDRFERNPERYGDSSATDAPTAEVIESGTDPICGMTVEFASAAAVRSLDGVRYPFCCQGCVERFDREHAAPEAIPHA